MALTASDLITDAAGQAYPYLGDRPLPTLPLLRTLGALDYEVVQTAAIEAPHALAGSSATLTVVSATNVTGYALQAALRYRRFTYLDASGIPTKLTIVPDKKRDHPNQHPSGYILGATFFPIDPHAERWATLTGRAFFTGDGDTIHYTYIALPGLPASESATLVSPDYARDYFVQTLRLHLLLQYPGVPETVLQAAVTAISNTRSALLFQLHKSAPVESLAAEEDL